MIRFVRLTDGIPTSWGTRPDSLPAGAVEIDPDTFAALPGVWFDGAAWVARPTVTGFAETAEGVAFTGLPSGAVVSVEDGETAEVLATVTPTGGAADIALPDPGPYELRVGAPAPWLPWTARIVR